MTTLSTYTLTYNCGRNPIRPSTFSTHLFSALPSRSQPPDILVLCLQEIAPIAYSFLGGSYLVPYLSPLRHAVTLAGTALDNADYVNIITRNVGMTAIMVFVLRDQTSQVQWMETAGVGVGVHAMGNKGAVAIRMGWSIGDSLLDLTLVSAHLAPMEDAVARRNEDWKNIVRGLVFTPVSSTALSKRTNQRLPQEPSMTDTDPLLSASAHGESDTIPPMTGVYTPTSHLILAGDLNYRTSITPPDPHTYLSYPQPTSDRGAPTHYSHLLLSDQLTAEKQAGRTCHSLLEAPITFPPTYKYSEKARVNASKTTSPSDDEGHWDWSKHRYPSWCDRILYLDLPAWMRGQDQASGQVKVQGYTALPLMETSDHRPVACSILIPAKPIPEPSAEDEEEMKQDVRLTPPFGIDPLWRENRERARRKEVAVGILAYLGLTWGGRGMMVAVIFGALGGWALVQSMLQR